jgi:hypothetical protein
MECEKYYFIIVHPGYAIGCGGVDRNNDRYEIFSFGMGEAAYLGYAEPYIQ